MTGPGRGLQRQLPAHDRGIADPYQFICIDSFGQHPFHTPWSKTVFNKFRNKVQLSNFRISLDGALYRSTDDHSG